ncbi:hypothetical protein O3Q51_07090 [Cryomorphaceae bacterium 1068]|nr:hypothetical protein [Cryomorphaceae bacterium 1068]
MKKRLLIASIAIAIGALASACTVNKKKKCDTCPKWTSGIVSHEIIQHA